MTATANVVKRPERARRARLSGLGRPAVVLTGMTLLLAACGSPGSHVAQLGSTTVSSAKRNGPGAPTAEKYAASLAYSRCMRSHGVPSFPDPTQIGGGIQIAGSAPGIDPQSPLFKSAERSCKHVLPNGGQPPTHAEQQQALTRMLHSSQCMRAHRIAGFPDPTLSPPGDRAGHSAIMSNGIAWLAIPGSIDVRAPAFRRAAAVCNLGLS